MRSQVAAVFVCLLAACSSITGADAVGSARIRVVSGDAATDTIDAPLAQPLIVEVRRADGALATGAEVRFTSLPTGSGLVAWVWVGPEGGAARQRVVLDTVDGQGRASALLRFGILAGTARIEIALPALGLVDTVRYTILPGKAAAVVALPADTATYVGNGFRFRVSVVDRGQNPRADSVTFATDSAAATVSNAGLVTGAAIGRARLRVSAAGITATTWVSVVPRGTLAGVGDDSRVTIIELDGSNRRVLGDPGGTSASWVDWNPRGDTLVLASSDGDSWVYVTGMNGPARRLITATTGLLSEYRPQYSGDGQWIYFSGRDDFQNQAIWRVHADGSAPERVGPPSGYYDDDSQPSPSRDGQHAAYLTNRCCYPELGLRLLHAATGTVDSLAPAALSPRWSPGDSLIAFVQNGVWVIRPDGSGLRKVSLPGHFYAQGVDWSPDGAWLVARIDFQDNLELIRLADGLTLPLPYASMMWRPAWRP
jgi:hypothetical protein